MFSVEQIAILHMFRRKTASYPWQSYFIMHFITISLFHSLFMPNYDSPTLHSDPHSPKHCVLTCEVCRSVFGGSSSNQFTLQMSKLSECALKSFEFKEYQESKSLELIQKTESNRTFQGIKKKTNKNKTKNRYKKCWDTPFKFWQVKCIHGRVFYH